MRSEFTNKRQNRLYITKNNTENCPESEIQRKQKNSYRVWDFCHFGLEGDGWFLASVGHQFVEQEDHADVGCDVNHVGGKSFVEPSHRFLPAETRFKLWLQNRHQWRRADKKKKKSPQWRGADKKYKHMPPKKNGRQKAKTASKRTHQDRSNEHIKTGQRNTSRQVKWWERYQNDFIKEKTKKETACKKEEEKNKKQRTQQSEQEEGFCFDEWQQAELCQALVLTRDKDTPLH